MRISMAEAAKYQKRAEYLCEQLLGIDPEEKYQDDYGYFEPVWMKYACKIAEHAMIAEALRNFEAT